MNAFGILGMTFGIIGLVTAMKSIKKIAKLEAELKRRGVIEPEFSSEK